MIDVIHLLLVNFLGRSKSIEETQCKSIERYFVEHVKSDLSNDLARSTTTFVGQYRFC
jgi:hypothetical protein